jgi:hypothetical protein
VSFWRRTSGLGVFPNPNVPVGAQCTVPWSLPDRGFKKAFEPSEKEVQDSSCRGTGGVPQIYTSPPRLGDIGGS